MSIALMEISIHMLVILKKKKEEILIRKLQQHICDASA